MNEERRHRPSNLHSDITAAVAEGSVDNHRDVAMAMRRSNGVDKALDHSMARRNRDGSSDTDRNHCAEKEEPFAANERRRFTETVAEVRDNLTRVVLVLDSISNTSRNYFDRDRHHEAQVRCRSRDRRAARRRAVRILVAVRNPSAREAAEGDADVHRDTHANRRHRPRLRSDWNRTVADRRPVDKARPVRRRNNFDDRVERRTDAIDRTAVASNRTQLVFPSVRDRSAHRVEHRDAPRPRSDASDRRHRQPAARDCRISTDDFHRRGRAEVSDRRRLDALAD